MKKLAIVLVMLVLAVPAMAATITVSATQDAPDSNVVSIKYAVTGGDAAANVPRAFALKISVTNKRGQIANVGTFDPNFRVSPGSFTLDSVTKNVTNWGNRIAANDGNTMITEMGSLYASNDPCTGVGYQTAPLLQGTLLKFRIRDNQDCNVILSLDTLRGGIVVENSALTPTIVFQNLTPFHMLTADVLPPTPNPATWASAPAQVTGSFGTTAITMTATTATDATTPPVEYLFTCTGGTGGHSSSWQSSPTYVDTLTAAGNGVTFTYTVQTRDSVVPTPNVGTASAPASAILACMKNPSAPASIYTDWVSWGRPKCWCYQRNCKGDADGLKTGFWVALADLNLLRAGFNKTDAQLLLVTNGICADFDHLKTGFRVALADLNLLRANFNKIDAQVPVCANTNYNFWTN